MLFFLSCSSYFDFSPFLALLHYQLKFWQVYFPTQFSEPDPVIQMSLCYYRAAVTLRAKEAFPAPSPDFKKSIPIVA